MAPTAPPLTSSSSTPVGSARGADLAPPAQDDIDAIALNGKATCVALHPGWVRTDMGGPGAELPADHSVASMRRTLATLTPADNGRFLNHDGQGIDW